MTQHANFRPLLILFATIWIVACGQIGSNDTPDSTISGGNSDDAASSESLLPSPTPDETPPPTPDPAAPLQTRAAETALDNVVVEPPDETVELVTLDIALVGPTITTLDPQRIDNEAALNLFENLFVGLTRQNPQTGAIEPVIAESWSVSEDGTRWTFTLRDDMFWVRPVATTTNVLLNNRPSLQESQALRPILAEDFVFAIERVCNPVTQSPNAFVLYLIQGCEARHLGPAEGESIPPLGVSAPDSQTIIFELNRPATHFLSITALPLMRPVPAEIIREAEPGDWSWAEDSNEIISNGPYLFDPQSIRGTQLVLQRNPFWPLPYEGNIEAINLFQFQNSLDSFASWEQRNLDIIPLPDSLQEQVMSESFQKLVVDTDHVVFYTAFNFESQIFQNEGVRRAFSAAINREEIIEQVLTDQGLSMRHFSPPGSVGAPPIDQIGIGYDPDYARQQLFDGGVINCATLPEIRYMVSSSDDALFQAELIREMWVEELGCSEEKIIIEQVQFGTLLASTRQNPNTPRPDVWDLGWAAYYPDANNWFEDVLHCTESDNRNKRPCSDVDTQILRASQLPADERVPAYREIEELFFGRNGLSPIVPLYISTDFELRQSWIVYTPSTFGGEQFDRYTIDWELKKLEKQQ